MTGMSKQTGQELTGIEHLMQSVNDILTTPVGSRVMRRDYGSRLFELIDSPVIGRNIVAVYAAVAVAVIKWENRLTLHRVQLKDEQQHQGKFVLELTISYANDLFNLPYHLTQSNGLLLLENGQPIQLENNEYLRA